MVFRERVRACVHVCMCVCVMQTLNPLSTYYVPGTLLGPQNHPARWRDQHHFSDGETEVQKGSEVPQLVKEQRTGSQDHQTPGLEQLSLTIPVGMLWSCGRGRESVMEGLGTARHRRD